MSLKRRNSETTSSEVAHQRVPDAVRRPFSHLRDPSVIEELRREAARLDEHPETEAINEWLEAMLDTSDWPPYEWTSPIYDDNEPDGTRSTQ